MSTKAQRQVLTDTGKAGTNTVSSKTLQKQKLIFKQVESVKEDNHVPRSMSSKSAGTSTTEVYANKSRKNAAPTSTSTSVQGTASQTQMAGLSPLAPARKAGDCEQDEARENEVGAGDMK